MNDSADLPPATSAATPKSARLYWLPAFLGGVPWLVWLAAKAHGGLEGVAALSGANPNPALEWVGGIYLAAWFATVAVSPSMIIASVVLWGWERAGRPKTHRNRTQ